jgi:hypothetical protein
MRANRTGNLIAVVTMLALCALMATGGALQAQRGGGGRGGARMDPAQMLAQMKERVDAQYKEMCETLVLTDQQQKQADELFKKAQDDRAKLFEKISGDRSEMRSTFGKIRKAQDDFMKELKKMLTDEQKERFELIKKEMEERRNQRPGRNR